MNIPVQVPDTDQFPVLSASLVPPLSAPVISDWEDAALLDTSTGYFRLDSHSPQTVHTAAREAQKDDPSGMDVLPIYREINELSLDTAYAYNNPATVRDAQAMMDAVWAANFASEHTVLTPYAVYATGEMRTYTKISDSYSGDPWPYQGVMMVYFHQLVGDIPVLCRGESCFGGYGAAPSRTQTLPIGATAILQKMPDDTAMFYSAQSQYLLSKTAEATAAELPLCELDTVIRTLEGLIADGLLRKADSLQLGYVAWQTGDDLYTLVPTWVLTGDLYKSAQAETRILPQNADPRIQEHGIILLSAQTGELIDPTTVDLQNLY